jgi:hypothetical protein
MLTIRGYFTWTVGASAAKCKENEEFSGFSGAGPNDFPQRSPFKVSWRWQMETWLDMFRKPRKYKPRKSSQKKREKLMDRTVAVAIATDPEVEREWIETKYGICIAEVDSITKAAEELRRKWSKQTLQILGEDEDSQESAIQALVKEIKKHNARSEKLHDEVEADFEEIDEHEQSYPHVSKRNLRREKIERPGDMGKNNRAAAEDNIKAVKLIFSQLVKRISSPASDGRSSQTISVEVNGEFIEMSPEAFRIFKKQQEEIRALQARLKGLSQQVPNSEPPHPKVNPEDAGV